MGNGSVNPMFEGKRAALFDLDGVLLDSLWVWNKVGLDFFTENEVPIDRQLVREIQDMSFAQSARWLVERFGMNITPEGIVDDWNKRAFFGYANEVVLMPGAGTLVRRLMQEGLRLAVVTASDAALAKVALERNGIMGAFDVVVTENETGLYKDGPGIFEHAARLLDVPPGSCVVFEDSLYAMRAAKAAGMAVCAICPPEREAEASAYRAVADACVQSLEMLLPADE